MGPDHYAILGVGSDADAAQITRAFRHLLRSLHPDAADQDPDSAERLGQVLKAWRVLHDPEARAAYDRTRAVPAPAARATEHQVSGSHPDSNTDADTDIDLVVDPTVVHTLPSRPPRPVGPHIRVGPTVRLDG